MAQKCQRTAIFPVVSNSQVFAYPDETAKQEIGDLYGRPGTDDDNDTTESQVKKQMMRVIINLSRALEKQNRDFDGEGYLRSMQSKLSCNTKSSSMKLDESRGIIDGSSIAEETLTNLSASRFTETAAVSKNQDGNSSIDSRKLSMDTEDNFAQIPALITDFAKPGLSNKVCVPSYEPLG